MLHQRHVLSRKRCCVLHSGNVVPPSAIFVHSVLCLCCPVSVFHVDFRYFYVLINIVKFPFNRSSISLQVLGAKYLFYVLNRLLAEPDLGDQTETKPNDETCVCEVRSVKVQRCNGLSVCILANCYVTCDY